MTSGIWGSASSLLEAAVLSRQRDIIENHGSVLTTDACDSGGYLRRRRSLRMTAARVTTLRPIPSPVQLVFWGPP